MDVFVRQRDSFWYYSQLFQVPFQLILDSNRNVDPSTLIIGQRISIPGFVASKYQIKHGDSLWSIAITRNIPLDTLFLVNPELNPNHLQIGQTIKVPLRITWRLVNGKQPYSYATMMDDLNKLKFVYPFIQVSTIGKTILEREIPEVLLGNGPKNIHYNASFHANEWITTSIIMTFLNNYLLSLTNRYAIRGLITSPLYEQTSLSIVPMVNPDGVELVLNGPPWNEPWKSNVIHWNKGNEDFSRWKANIRGVDLNDQFPANWEAERERTDAKPGPRDYGGKSPLSEPEAVAMANLTKRRDFARVLAFHTQGKVIYWGYKNFEPPEAKVLVTQFSKVSGYEAVQTIESYAGYRDWFIQEWRRSGFTVELGTGTNPLPLTQFDEIYEETLGICLAALYM